MGIKPPKPRFLNFVFSLGGMMQGIDAEDYDADDEFTELLVIAETLLDDYFEKDAERFLYELDQATSAGKDDDERFKLLDAWIGTLIKVHG